MTMPSPPPPQPDQERAEELNRIHRALVVIINDAETDSHVEALGIAVRDLTSVVANFTSVSDASA